MTPADAADVHGAPGGSGIRRGLRWLFVNRQTGHITVAQRPNLSLSLFLVLWLARYVFGPTGDVEDVLQLLGAAALVWWSADELSRGVNPFRRILGLVVLIATVSSLAARAL